MREMLMRSCLVLGMCAVCSHGKSLFQSQCSDPGCTCGRDSKCGDCYCDSPAACVQYGNCCSDHLTTCPAPPTPAPGPLCASPSCSCSPDKQCGYCYCDTPARCAQYGNCCSDHLAACPGPPPPSPPPTPPTPPPSTICAGNSTALMPAQCAAWLALFDAVIGGGLPRTCRNDPCSCKPASGPPSFCGHGGTVIINFDLRPGLAGGEMGPLPAAISALTSLETIAITKTKIGGPLPPGFGVGLTNLSTLLISHNQFSGPLPSDWTALTNLTALNLEGNSFDGALPNLAPGLSFSHFGSCMLYTQPKSNAFTCPLPPWALACYQGDKTLTPVTGADCLAPQPVPTRCSGRSAGLSKAQCDAWVDLYDGCGGVAWKLACPSSVGRADARTQPCACKTRSGPGYYFCDENSTDITTIKLGGDGGMNGTLPASLAALTALTTIDVWGNALQGPLDGSFLSAWPGLFSLLIYNNNFTGALPATMSSLKHLKHIGLYGNAFTGPLPELPHLNTTALEGCAVYGNPATNRFDCPLPAWVHATAAKAGASCTSARRADNKAVPVPPWQCFTPPPAPTACTGWSAQLDTAQCAGWIAFYDEMNGPAWKTPAVCPVPPGRKALPSTHQRTDPCACRNGASSYYCGENKTDITTIALSKQDLVGTLPAALAALTGLTAFLVDTNQIIGSLPGAIIAAWQQLTQLDVSTNGLSGPLPRELASLNQLTSFAVDDNRFTGPLPPMPWANFSKCVLLDTTQQHPQMQQIFTCPLPSGAIAHCTTTSNINININECGTAAPTPSPTPGAGPLFRCVGGQCVPGSAGDGVPRSECAELCSPGEVGPEGVGAGVVVGSCAATLALGGALAVLHRRRQRRLQQASPFGKTPLLTGFLDAGGKQQLLVDHVEDLEAVIGGRDGVALESI